MKMQPIEYAEVYDGEPYFKPYRAECGVQVFNRALVAMPGRSKDGMIAWIKFGIVDNYRQTTVSVFPKGDEPIVFNRVRDEITFQAHDFTKVMMLIKNLASGDLRGRAAEQTVSVLLYELYAFGPGVKKWLPRVRQTFLENRKTEREARKERKNSGR